MHVFLLVFGVTKVIVIFEITAAFYIFLGIIQSSSHLKKYKNSLGVISLPF